MSMTQSQTFLSTVKQNHFPKGIVIMSLLFFKIVSSKCISQIAVVCCCLVTKSCPALLQPHELRPTRLLCPWDFPGKNTRVGCHTPLQGIFPTQGSNLCLLHWQADSSLLSHQGSPLANWSDCLQNRTI